MNIEKVEKKLREALFFLEQMSEQEGRAVGDREPFDFYLSAFLSACRTVDYRLRHEQSAVYPAWRKKWDTGLKATESELVKFMVDDRNIEVHESGSSRAVKPEGVEIVGNLYRDKSSVIEVFAPPGTPPAVLYRPSYSFTVSGRDRKATSACGEYLSLLERLVTEFKRDHP